MSWTSGGVGAQCQTRWVMERIADVHSFEVSARSKVKPTSVLTRVVVWVVVWVVVLSILKKKKGFSFNKATTTRTTTRI